MVSRIYANSSANLNKCYFITNGATDNKGKRVWHIFLMSGVHQLTALKHLQPPFSVILCNFFHTSSRSSVARAQSLLCVTSDHEIMRKSNEKPHLGLPCHYLQSNISRAAPVLRQAVGVGSQLPRTLTSWHELPHNEPSLVFSRVSAARLVTEDTALLLPSCPGLPHFAKPLFLLLNTLSTTDM